MSDYVQKHGEIISNEVRRLISARYHTVTYAVNRAFRGNESSTANSLYVGSYGRGTAIETSDIDILVELPESEYDRYDYARGNGQSRLLQAVKSAIQNSYPRSDVRADGQVIKIAWLTTSTEARKWLKGWSWQGKTSIHVVRKFLRPRCGKSSSCSPSI